MLARQAAWRVLGVLSCRAVMRKPTIYEALRQRLGREPTHRELCDDVRRILEDGMRERAALGKLRYQRRK